MKIPDALNASHSSMKLVATIEDLVPLVVLPLQMQRDFVQHIRYRLAKRSSSSTLR